MRRLARFLVVMAVASLSYACSSSSEKAPPSLQYDPPAELNVKSGQTWTETDLDADSQLAFTENNNVVVFLSDSIEPEPDADVSGVDLGGVRGADTVPMEILTADIYKMCLILNDDALPVSLTLADSDKQLLRIDKVDEETNYYCRDIRLEPGVYQLTLTIKPETLSDDMPFLLAFEGKTIAVKYNDFSYADLRGTDLSNRGFVNTTFVGADLELADFTATRLYSNDFTDAYLWGTNFSDSLRITPTGLPFMASEFDQRKGYKMQVNFLNVDNGVFKFAGTAFGIKHTYPVICASDTIDCDDDSNPNRWGALGRSTGGSALAGTVTECAPNEDCIDLETVNFIMTKAPCMWPYSRMYLTVGVCWNATNRGLYFTGKTVKNVPYYTFIETYFGTYGLDKNSWCAPFTKCAEGREKYAWSDCLAEVKKNHPWEGWDYLSPKASMASVGKASESVNPRITLYQQYAESNDNSGVSAMSSSRSPMSELQYLQELLKLNIAEKVGEISPAALAEMLEAHEAMYYGLRSLDGFGEGAEDFNAIMRETQEKYLYVLGVDDYLKLMNLEEFPKDDFDILDFQ